MRGCEPFRIIAARLDHLELCGFTHSEAVDILQLPRSLTSVILIDDTRKDVVGDEEVLAESLADLKSLRSLTLSQYDDELALTLGRAGAKLD